MPAPRVPTNVKVLRGTDKQHPGRLNPREPKLKRGWPKPPSEMTENARKFWREFCEVIDEHNVLTEYHGRAIAEICEIYALILDLRGRIEEAGTVIEEINVKGDEKTKINPAVPQLISAQKTFYGMISQFGLTPSALGKVSGLDGDKDGENPQVKKAAGFFD